MKRILFLLALLCLENVLHAQYVYTIKADSVKITNTCDTAELIIENHTQNVPGFLFNKGRGRTEFRRAAQLDDTTVVIGGDSIHLGRGGKNFANADLTFTGDRNHDGLHQYLNLNKFGGIYLKTDYVTDDYPGILTLDTLEGFRLSIGENTTFNSSVLHIDGGLFTFDTDNPFANTNSSFVLHPEKLQYTTSNSDFSNSSLIVSDGSFSLGTNLGTGGDAATSSISAGIPHDGGIEMDLNVRNGVMQLRNDNSVTDETIFLRFNKADSFEVSTENTRYIQYKDEFLFRAGQNNLLDFRLFGLPPSTNSTDSVLVIDDNGQVKKGAPSGSRKSTTVTAGSYTVPADIDVVFVNYTGGTPTISLPSGTLDREITIKNLNTTNTVILSGLDTSESNTVAALGAITIKYTGSAWVGISKY
jgi:hypothetical protein